jgi:hypothetical protein
VVYSFFSKPSLAWVPDLLPPKEPKFGQPDRRREESVLSGPVGFCCFLRIPYPAPPVATPRPACGDNRSGAPNYLFQNTCHS